MSLLVLRESNALPCHVIIYLLVLLVICRHHHIIDAFHLRMCTRQNTFDDIRKLEAARGSATAATSKLISETASTLSTVLKR